MSNTYRRITWAVAAAAVVAGTAVTVVLALGVPTAPDTPAQSSGRQFDEAMGVLAKGDPAAAVIRLKNAIRTDGNNAEARLALGLLYLGSGDGASAEKEFRAARRAGMDAARLLPPLMQACARQEHYRDILDEPLPETLPAEVRAVVLALRGRAFLALGRPVEARAEAAAAMTADPRAPDPHLVAALVAQTRGDAATAERHVDNALGLAPTSVGALLAKADLRRAAADIDGAFHHYGRVLEVDSDNAEARLRRGLLYLLREQHQEAAEDIAVALKAAPDQPIANYARALLLTREKKFAQAMDVIQPHIPALESYPPALHLLGVLHLAQGRIGPAQDRLRQYVAAAPDSIAGRKLLASAYLRSNDGDRALDLLATLAGEAPDDMDVAAMLGDLHMARHDYARAVAFHERVAKQAPDDDDARVRLAVARLQAGDGAAAIRDLEAVIARDPTKERAAVLLVLTHVREGHHERATKVVESLRRRLPDGPLLDNLAGMAAAAKGDDAAARTAFETALRKRADFVPAALNLAGVDARQGRNADARRRYEAALKLEPANVAVMLALADLEFADGRGDRGLEWLERAAAQGGKDIRPRLRLVEALLDRKRPERALLVARELAEAAPRDASALQALARAQTVGGQHAAAIASYRAALAVDPRSGSVIRLYDALRAAGDHGGARALLEEWTARRPGDSLLRFSLAADLMTAGAYPQAIGHYEALLKVHPDSVVVLNNLAWLYGRTGDRRALDLAGKALVLAPDAADVADTLGWLLVRSGEARRAIPLLEQARAKAPDDPGIAFHLAEALALAGERGRAVEVLRPAIDGGRPFVDRDEALKLDETLTAAR
ncbi:MAG: PEP-CTERM system TPR-repeat protein PrsT [Alphaproteobacteria bacterium]